MKKSLLIILLSLVCMSSLGYAYLTGKDNTQNIFTIGNNTTEINEIFPVSTLKPNDTIEKIVQIENKESVDCYVRAMVKFSNEDELDTVSLDFNDSDWKLVGDYYYYKDILKVGQKTTPIFNKVSASNYDSKAFDIIVYEESVQSEHYASALDAFKGIGG